MTIPSVVTVFTAPPDPALDDSTTYSSKASTFTQKMKSFGDELIPIVAAMNVDIASANLAAITAVNAPGAAGTSVTSLTIGTGAQSFTTQTGKNWQLGQPIMIASTASPTNWMAGTCTAYNSGSGAMTVNCALTNGSGTLASWTVSLCGPIVSYPGAAVLATGGTGTAYTLTPTPALGAYGAGPTYMVQFSAASGATPTFQVSGLATPPNLVKQVADGSYQNIAAGDVPLNHRSRVTLLSSTQAWVEDMPPVAEAGLYKALSAAVAANALTVTVTPNSLEFRSVTLTSGAVVIRSSSANLTLTVPSTATLGTVSTVPHRLWVVEMDNAGTKELAIMNTQLGGGQIVPITASGVISTTTISAAANLAGVWYSTSSRSNVAYRVVGYIESTQTTAGTWAAAPSVIQPHGPGVRLPGELVQKVFTVPGTGSSVGTTQLPADSTIPQNTEGDPVFQQAITPTSAINTLTIDSMVLLSSNGAAGTVIGIALFQDAAANALRAAGEASPVVSYSVQLVLRHFMQAGTVSATTFKIRAGGNAVQTTTLDAKYGNVSGSYLEVSEIMV